MKRNYTMLLAGLLLFSTLSLSSCGNKNKASETVEEVTAVQTPQFDADSAYQYVKSQVDFGPRVPNSKNTLPAVTTLHHNWKNSEPK